MKHLRLFENFDHTEIYYHGTKHQFSTFKLGNAISNPTYGGGIVDQDLGIFFTDNLIMAKWFAGRTEYDADKTEDYVDIPGPGRVVSAKLDIQNPWIMNDQISDVDEDDPGQDYFDIVKEAGGGVKFRKKLMDEGYDAVIVKDATTNYYADGGYDIIVVFEVSQIKVISKDFQ